MIEVASASAGHEAVTQQVRHHLVHATHVHVPLGHMPAFAHTRFFTDGAMLGTLAAPRTLFHTRASSGDFPAGGPPDCLLSRASFAIGSGWFLPHTAM